MNRLFFLRSETDRILLVSMTFSILLVMAGVVYTGRLIHLFLVWNLFLAYIPYWLTSRLQDHAAWRNNKRVRITVFLLWILFIPNSFYILTDLFHLGGYTNIPLWFDLAMLLSFAWNGLLLGLLSVRQMEKILRVRRTLSYELLFIYPVMLLNAFGIYIGRYLRFNSWDVFTNPFEVIASIFAMLLHPLRHVSAWGMIGCYSIFMTLMYLAVKKISKVIH